MPKLELTEPEADLLREIAEEWLSDLRVEIGHTDNLDYREGLKKKEALLHHVLDRLGVPVTVPSRP
jgi:hypothetical protein